MTWEKTVQMTQLFTDNLEENENFVDEVWFSDEADFYISRQVETVFCGSEVPREVVPSQ